LSPSWQLRKDTAIMANSKDSSLRKLICGFEHENEAYESGATIVAGLDEVGRGALFSVVTSAAVILPRDCKLEGLRDSKLISPKRRQRLAAEIKAQALAWSVAHVEAAEIDRTNIAAATEMSMYEAIHGLAPVMPDLLLIDAVAVDIPIEQISIIHGDAVSASIAAASIVAKVTRDALMEELDAKYPGYGIGQHKGYGTAAHLKALETLGPTPLHRMSFAPLLKIRFSPQEHRIGISCKNGQGPQ
jgi:ribonuclease HII